MTDTIIAAGKSNFSDNFVVITADDDGVPNDTELDPREACELYGKLQDYFTEIGYSPETVRRVIAGEE